MVSGQARPELEDAVEARLGEGPAGTLMELVAPVGWGDLARQPDHVAVRGEVAAVRGEVAELRGEITAQLPRLVAANMGTAFATAGLVLAAAKLA